LGERDKAIADYCTVLRFERDWLGRGVRMNKLDEFELSEQGLKRLGAAN
jgi:hypothetical protein